MRKEIKKVGLFVLIMSGVLLLAIYNQFIHNFFEVIPGEVYRSRELSGKEFKQAIRKYHIKSIINLRGQHPKEKWYREEVSAARDMGIEHYDVCLSSYRLPDAQVLKDLVNILNRAKRPMLIHCNSGVDRTSLGSTLILLLAKEQPLSDIQEQVSWHYFIFRKDSVGKQILSQYETWLQKNNLSHCHRNFFNWLQHFYEESV